MRRLILILAAGLLCSCKQTPSAELLASAEKGDVDAQRELGDMYADGKGVREDWPLARKWYRRAAEQGDADAQCRLADRYLFVMQGEKSDKPEAVKWYRKAADQGHAEAQFALGLCYEKENGGWGVPRDMTEAMKWFHKSAAQGYEDAENRLGIIYEVGADVPEDKVEAYKWYRLAGAQHQVRSGEKPGVKISADELGRTMTPGQRAEGERRAREFKPAKAPGAARQ